MEQEGDVPPPTEYRRMLSWQLSHVQAVPVTKAQKTQKKKRIKRAGSSLSSNDAGRVDSYSIGDEESVEGEGEYAYLVVNSEGEEEWYYSAPESPPDSGDDGEEEGEVCLPPQERKRGRRSKKGKKKIRSVVRLAEIEFFGPLCDLVEGSLEVEVGGLEVSSQVEVPSLTELCVRCVHTEKLAPASEMDDNVPFLIHALVGAHRSHRSLMGTHVRWLERFLAAWEIQVMHINYKCHRDSPSPCSAYYHRPLWTAKNVTVVDVPDSYEGLHLPLPFPPTTNICLPDFLDWEEVINMKSFMKRISSLLHFANYLYPLFTARGSAAGVGDSDGLSSSQISAIAYVNHLLTSRYKILCQEHSEALKLWPGYVYWARGQLKLALSTFTAAVDSLQYAIDKAVTLNEIGRMLLMFGDRSKATLFFNKSQEVDVKLRNPLKELVQPSFLALEASVWDCGVLSASVARQAALAWYHVLYISRGLPSALWYLHVAAVESRMMVHAGRPVGSNPGSPLSTVAQSSPAQWLTELLELVSSLATTHHILHYHHSLLHAMDGRINEARQVFLRFCDDFVVLREWGEDGIPGDPFSVVTNRRLLNPWLPLSNMLKDQGLTAAPVLRLKWRTRLLHPMYPYVNTRDVNYLADHCSSSVNLRLSATGYVTADIQMDFPPLRCVFLDPYTGSVCFSRSASLHHHLSSPVGHLIDGLILQDETVLPWPVRVCEWREGIVELVMSGCVDMELGTAGCVHLTNQSATLHWYCHSDHCKLDLRLAIRKELKKAVLQAAEQQKMDMDGKEALLTAMMERGFAVTAEALKATKLPSKYNHSKPLTHHKTGSTAPPQKPRRVRNYYVKSFNLHLTDYVVFGEATLAMCFSLAPYMYWTDTFCGHVIVLINCTSRRSFLKPCIYCVGDYNYSGFIYIQPSNKQAACYPARHLPHVRCMVVSHLEADLVIDQNGEVVYEHQVNPARRAGRRHVWENAIEMKFSLGERIYHWTTDLAEVTSYNMKMRDCLHSIPYPNLVLQSVVPIPGCLLVHTTLGLSLLHPGSLQPVELENLKTPEPGMEGGRPSQQEREDSDTTGVFQFPVQSATFNILCVFNVEGSDSCGHVSPLTTHSHGSEERGREESEGGGEGEGGAGDGEDGEEGGEVGNDEQQQAERRRELGGVDFGSCCVALTLNNRLLIISVPHRTEVVRVLVDVLMPGKVTELYPMEGFGFMLSVTQFPDCFRFREEVYWLSPSGKLRGMLPALGAGPRSFISATLPPRSGGKEGEGEGEGEGEDDEESGGLSVFFSDGQGGVCCVQPSID